MQCNTNINSLSETLTMRVSYLTYCMVIVATLGWIFFMVFGGIGMVSCGRCAVLHCAEGRVPVCRAGKATLQLRVREPAAAQTLAPPLQVALPLDWIREFIGRPTKTITKSEYIARARDIARRAKDIRWACGG